VSAVSGTSAGTTASRTASLAPRIGLVLVALSQADVGIWGLVAPHSFFRGFPGGGHRWVAGLGTYNEHLIRDYAASEVGFAVLLIGAAIWFSRRVVLLAGIAFLAGTLPHFIYHLTTTDSFSTTDNIASLGGFVLELVLVGLAMRAAARAPS
jgi:hypothetical protein